jgi:hypothetical protein
LGYILGDFLQTHLVTLSPAKENVAKAVLRMQICKLGVKTVAVVLM